MYPILSYCYDDITNMAMAHHLLGRRIHPDPKHNMPIPFPLLSKQIYNYTRSYKWYVEKNVVKTVISAQLGKRLFSSFVLSTRNWSSTATSILNSSEELACNYFRKMLSTSSKWVLICAYRWCHKRNMIIGKGCFTIPVSIQ